MTNSTLQFRFLIAFMILAGVAAVLWAADHYQWAQVPSAGQLVFRWAALGAIFVFALLRRSLTTWIVVGMLLGAEIGHDWPGLAANLQILSSIFLRLIKTIIAPLIFSTLVVGIAGHSNLKQVGRMGIKALLYFEAVTTLALFIGLAAINISKAGVGIPPMPGAHDTAQLAVTKQTGSDIILHI